MIYYILILVIVVECKVKLHMWVKLHVCFVFDLIPDVTITFADIVHLQILCKHSEIIVCICYQMTLLQPCRDSPVQGQSLVLPR